MDELRASGLLRSTRALLSAAVAALLGLTAHVGAGGLLPSPVWCLAGGAVLVGVNLVALGGPASLWRVIALVAGGQAFWHLGLTALAGHAGGAAAAGTPRAVVAPAAVDLTSGERRGSLYDLTVGARPPSGDVTARAPGWVLHLVGDLTGPHALMMAAHLLAAAAVAAWLWVGESTLWALLCLLGAAASTVASVVAAGLVVHPQPAAVPPVRRHVVAGPGPPPRLALPPPLLGALARRGPPALVTS